MAVADVVVLDLNQRFRIRVECPCVMSLIDAVDGDEVAQITNRWMEINYAVSIAQAYVAPRIVIVFVHSLSMVHEVTRR